MNITMLCCYLVVYNMFNIGISSDYLGRRYYDGRGVLIRKKRLNYKYTWGIGGECPRPSVHVNSCPDYSPFHSVFSVIVLYYYFIELMNLYYKLD